MIKKSHLAIGCGIALVFGLLTLGITFAQEGPPSKQPITAVNAGALTEFETLTGQGDTEYTSIAISPDGSRVAAGTEEDGIHVWDMADKSKLMTIPGSAKILSLAYSPDGAMLAASSWDSDNKTRNTVYIYDAVTGDELVHLSYKAYVSDLTFSPDGAQLVTASSSSDPKDYAVRFWDTTTGAELPDLFLKVDNSGIVSVALTSDGNQVAFGFLNITLLSDVNDHNQSDEFVYERPVPAGGGIMPGSWIVRYSNAILLFSVSDDAKTINSPLLFTGSQITFGSQITITNRSFSWMVSGVSGGCTGTFTSSIDVSVTCGGGTEIGHPTIATINKIAFSPDDRLIAISHNDGTIQVWDVETQELLRSFKAGNSFDDPVQDIAFSPDGSALASISSGGELRVWNVETGDLLADLPAYTDAYNGDVAFSADGALLLSLGGTESGPKIRIWGVLDGDGDGVQDEADNCPVDPNADQADTDEDGFGDACDRCPAKAGPVNGCPDTDEDGIADIADNCRTAANADQADFNADGHGDACQDSDRDTFLDAADLCPSEAGPVKGCPDVDEDNVADVEDNCPADANTDQTDFNADGTGDACQDSDDDGLLDAGDNCPADANPDQADFNADGAGDVCQDSDDDTFMDAEDQCPADAGPVGGCPDADDDGIADADDNCPADANADQADFNTDGTGDACQDTDSDTFMDAADLCPSEAGPAQGCPDADEDGIADVEDNCPADANADQADFNADGTGDACQDTDDDGLLDGEDNCPADAGTFEGCPDSDSDSIADHEDACPADAGPVETGGCPDADADGVADQDDECPQEAGFPEVKGCFFTGTVPTGSQNVNLRDGPGTNFAVVGVVTPADQFAILGRNEAGDWLRIRTIVEEGEEPLEAWVAAWLITTEAPVDSLPVVE